MRFKSKRAAFLGALVVTGFIVVSAAASIIAWRELPESQGEEVVRTGKFAALKVVGLPSMLRLKKPFRCYEVKLESGDHSAEIADGLLGNVNGPVAAYDLEITVVSGGQKISAVQSLHLKTGDQRDFFSFFDDENFEDSFKPIPGGLEDCEMKFHGLPTGP